MVQLGERVVYLDQSGDVNEKPVTVNNHDFVPEGMDSAVDPYVVLLYRPGHYDILYRKEEKSGHPLEHTEKSGHPLEHTEKSGHPSEHTEKSGHPLEQTEG